MYSQRICASRGSTVKGLISMNPFIQSRKWLPHAQGQAVDGASLSCLCKCRSSFFFATAGGVSPSSSFSSLFPKRPMVMTWFR